MRPIGEEDPARCWHCGSSVAGKPGMARYLYRGVEATTLTVEDWIKCPCGAFQNVRRVKRIHVSPLGRRTTAN